MVTKYMTWFMVDTYTLEMGLEILASVLLLSTPQMHHTESPFVIPTNDFSLKYTASQAATALLPPIRRINSLMMWPTIH